MNEIKIMNREETTEYFYGKLISGERIVATRYGDGEANLINSVKNRAQTGFENPNNLKYKIINSLKNTNNFPCINELKKKNIEMNDHWVSVQATLINNSQRKMYGSANWNVFDFQNGSKVLSLLFKKKTIVLTNYSNELSNVFNLFSISSDVYQTESKEMSDNYDIHLKSLKEIVSNDKYDTILFACGPCGPCGKAILTEIEPICKHNLVDIGSLVNAIIDGAFPGKYNMTKKWTMSWSKECNLPVCVQKLFKGR